MTDRFIITTVAAILLFGGAACKKSEESDKMTPEKALAELLEDRPTQRDPILDADYIRVGRPTFKIRTAPTSVPSHYATITGEMDCEDIRYRCTFTAFCKEGVWYFDPDGPMLLEQPHRSWSSSDPKYALHHCQMAATWCMGLKK